MEKLAYRGKPNTKPTLLVVEDDETTRAQLKWALGDEYELCLATDRPSALEAFRTLRPHLALLDLRLPPRTDGPTEGLAVLDAIRELDAEAQIIVLSGQTDQETARLALNQGACDFLRKPARLDELRDVLRCRSRCAALGREGRLPAEALPEAMPEALQGRSPQMREVLDNIRKVAATDAPVLILGETGTGKETAARTIHGLSCRAHGAFVAITCGSLREDPDADHLFCGPLAAAAPSQGGGIGSAAEGTLFLDGVHQLPLGLQARLLRILQSRAIGTIGERETDLFAARLIAATSMDLQATARTGSFLEELYYSLAVVVIQMPPLRERQEDIRTVARSLLRRFANQHRKPALAFEPDALQALERYPWPGNLRELENCLQRAVILTDCDRLRAEHLGLKPLSPRLRTPHGLKAARRDAERDTIVEALKRHAGKVSPAAAELGISRPTLYALLRKLNIERSSSSSSPTGASPNVE